MAARIVFLVAVLVFSTVSAWIMAFRMRRRIRIALDKEAKGAELTSIRTWMEVEEAEKRRPLGQ